MNDLLASISPALARQALKMLQPYRKNQVTCLSLLSELTEGPSRSPSINRTMPMSANGVCFFFFLVWFPKFLSADMFNPYKMPDHRSRCNLALPILIISGCQEGWNQQAVDGKRIGRNLNYSSVCHWSSFFRVTLFLLIMYVSCREKEHLGLSSKLATRLIREYTQVSFHLYDYSFFFLMDHSLVKKIRLKTMQSDTKIFREVNALSRLSHRNIVRYYTTWVETSEPQSTVASDDSSSEFVEDGMTSVPQTPQTSERHLPINGGFHINIEDFDDLSGSRSSFPSIHFGRSSSPGTSGEDSSGDDGFGSLFRSASSGSISSLVQAPTLSRTLYIQMVGWFYLSFETPLFFWSELSP